ncbi:hypothetical protein P9112_007481 [Eukaryota sp. TZLM1-RC]
MTSIYEKFTSLDSEPQTGEIWYIVPKNWYTQFIIHGKNLYPDQKPDDELKIPTSDLTTLGTIKLPQHPKITSKTLKPGLTLDQDVVCINESQWNLISVYFGSDDPIRREVVPKAPDSMEVMVDLYPLRLRLRQVGSVQDETLAASSTSSLGFLREQIASKNKVDKDKVRLSLSHPEFKALSSEEDEHSLTDLGIQDGSQLNVTIIKPQSIDQKSLYGTSKALVSEQFPSFSTQSHHYNLRNHVRTQPKGVTGLSNLGNTCFMNSIIQCVSHCTPLTEFCLSDQFKKDLNTTNPIGSGGKIASAWRETVNALWNGSSSVYTPTRLKSEIGKVAPQFLGYRQHDSQEFLLFLLDNLHEDLNRIINKPYFTEDITTTDEEEIARESIRRYKARNESVVSELFTGLFKSELHCPSCDKIAVTFDPTNQIAVPIPDRSNFSLSLKVAAFDFQQKKMVIFNVKVKTPKLATGVFIKKEVATLIGVPAESIALSKTGYGGTEHKVNLIGDQERVNVEHTNQVIGRVVNSVENGGIVLGKASNSKIVAIRHSSPKKTHGMTHYHTSFHNKEDLCTVLFSLNEDCSADDVREVVEIANQSLLTGDWQAHAKVTFSTYATGKAISLLADHDLKPAMTGYYSYNNNSPLEINVNWDGKENFKLFFSFDQEKQNFQSPELNHIESTNVSIYDCFDLFSKAETLDEQNEWYCPQCKEHKKADKKMDIYHAPDLLVVTLKRFKYDSFFRNKIDEEVDFPVRGLDLSKYVQSQDDLIYDLIGVSNHMGSMGGGHYIAYCYNPEAKKWFEFDDSRTREISEESVVSRMGYVLFYRRRKVECD